MKPRPSLAVAMMLGWGLCLAEPPFVLGYRVVASYPHDPTAFTQGLVFSDGWLYESTGQYGRSALRRIDLDTGRIEQEFRLADDLFGEGLSVWQGRLVQLTWRERLGIVYDARTFERLETFSYQGEGWGLTQDGRHWIMSDGTDELRFLDPETRQVIRRLKVRLGARPVYRLNELEHIEARLWSNVWGSDHLVQIAPETGQVTATLDLSRLYPPDERSSPEAVLNGIAYDPSTGHLFVTGKYWPRLYEILIKE